MLAIPNSQVVNSTVASYTNFPHLRLDVDFTVAVTENLARTRELVLGIVESDDRFMDDPEPTVVVTKLNDYNVAMQLCVWLDDERSHIAVRLELRERIFETLRDAGVEMPFETYSLTPLEMKTPARMSAG